MIKKRLLYLEDLYEFYSTHKRSTHFSADESHPPIVVQVKGTICFDSNDKNTDGLRAVHLQACHTGKNVNNSNIEDEIITAALPSLSNRPILAFIHKVNGQDEFYTHNMHEDEDGNIVYDEVPVGTIPESCNAQLVYDEEKEKKYVEVDGYLFEEYSKAPEILEREGECSVSVELAIREFSYNAKEKFLDIEDFYFSGVTILGKTPEGQTVKPGMEGSNIKLSDFSQKNNSLFTDYSKKFKEIDEKLEQLLSHFSNGDSEKGGKEMSKLEELLKKYGKKVEEITFSYKGLSDEELEEEFSKTFSDPNPEPENKTQENFVKSFEISHEDIRYALYALLADYEQADNEWYFINAVYDNHFTYENWEGDKIFGQSYTKDGDNVSFDGERWNLHRELLTDSEYAELQTMRANYNALVEFKENAEKNELHTKREEILANENFSDLKENEKFKQLIENMDNYSLTDLEKEAKVILADHLTNGGTFSARTKGAGIEVKKFRKPEKITRKSRYGSIFK